MRDLNPLPSDQSWFPKFTSNPSGKNFRDIPKQENFMNFIIKYLMKYANEHNTDGRMPLTPLLLLCVPPTPVR